MTGLVQRFLMRAYALDADDETISRTLTALAPSDFLAARLFSIPKHFREVTAHGDLVGCVSLPLFHQYQFAILEPAIRALESEHSKPKGISMAGPQPVAVGETPTFPENPYLVVTVLLETPDGHLIPQLSAR
jgi:hypothetical protein